MSLKPTWNYTGNKKSEFWFLNYVADTSKSKNSQIKHLSFAD